MADKPTRGPDESDAAEEIAAAISCIGVTMPESYFDAHEGPEAATGPGTSVKLRQLRNLELIEEADTSVGRSVSAYGATIIISLKDTYGEHLAAAEPEAAGAAGGGAANATRLTAEQRWHEGYISLGQQVRDCEAKWAADCFKISTGELDPDAVSLAGISGRP
jgi:hypothetical protein